MEEVHIKHLLYWCLQHIHSYNQEILGDICCNVIEKEDECAHQHYHGCWEEGECVHQPYHGCSIPSDFT
jgi:hypothetical protein